MKPVVALLLSCSIPALCQSLPAPNTADIDTPNVDASNLVLQPATTGSTLKHFAEIDSTGVYKGSRPKSDADFRFLQSLHVKYIVDVEVPLMPWESYLERRKARKYGITVLLGIMNASPIAPSEKHVDHILAILHDDRNHPIYFHCKWGRDRTAIIAALYQMYFENMSEEAAMQYLHDNGYGFKFGWLRAGLIRYVRKHPTPPADLAPGSTTPASAQAK
jgi:protein tyrosine/serine phosphatase